MITSAGSGVDETVSGIEETPEVVTGLSSVEVDSIWFALLCSFFLEDFRSVVSDADESDVPEADEITLSEVLIDVEDV